MKKNKISVIIPAYNIEDYISNNIRSVCAQTYENLEIILINDGSTDNTLHYAKQVLESQQVPYLILSQENKGVSSARNTGLDAATGDFIFFLDGDDELDDNCFSLMMDAIERHNADIACVDIMLIENGAFLRLNGLADFLQNDEEVHTNEELISWELTRKMNFSFCQFLYRKSILDQNSLRFTEGRTYGEDSHFLLMALLFYADIICLKAAPIKYMQRDDSAIHVISSHRFHFIDALSDLNEFYTQHGVPESLRRLITTYRQPESLFWHIMFLLKHRYPVSSLLQEMKKRNFRKIFKRFQPMEDNKRDQKTAKKMKWLRLMPRSYMNLYRILK